MFYAVFDINNKLVYTGSKLTQALEVFQRTSKASLESADSPEDLEQLILSKQSFDEEDDFEDEDDGDYDEDNFSKDAEYREAEDELFAIIDEVVDTTLERVGVTRDEVQDFVKMVKERGSEAAEDTKTLARQGFAVLSDVFTNIGKKLKNI